MLYKAHHIAGAQVRENNGATSETVLQKTTDERHVVDNRGFGQVSRLAQVLFVRRVCNSLPGLIEALILSRWESRSHHAESPRDA